jgi:hypothetical protein
MSANCTTAVGPYGKFQLVDPMMRNSSGYLRYTKHVTWEEDEFWMTLDFHFFFLEISYPEASEHKEYFERDLMALIKLHFHNERSEMNTHNTAVFYNKTIFTE